MADQKHCLVVDDSDVIREIAARIVADLGFAAAQARTAEEGVAHCRAHKTAVVLLDWDLPSMGALDFLRGAAELEGGEKPVIILCATENDPQQFMLAKAAGASHHLLKPFDRSVIEGVFAEAGLIAGPASPAATGTDN